MKLITTSEMQTEKAGSDFAGKLRRGDVVAMYGDLGAGKTAFVRGMAKGLGIKDMVSSPTFTIVNEHLGEIPLFHFDMYRLSGSDELFEIGWEDYLERGGICAVEWSENVSDTFEPDTITVDIKKLSDSEREITITFPEGRCVEK